MLHIRSNPKIRKQVPGMWEEFYDVRENLGAYTRAVINAHDLDIISGHRATGGMLGATIVCEEKNLGPIKIKIPSGDDAETEVYFYNRLRSKNVPVPRVYAVNIKKDVIPHEYLICEFVPGVHPAKGDEINRDSLQNIGQHLKKIHAITQSGFGKRIDDHWTQKNIADMLIKMLNEKFWNNPDAEPFSKSMLAYMKKMCKHPQLQLRKPHLMHGDMRADNVIVSDSNASRVKTFVDPGLNISGDPMSDLALVTIAWPTAEAKRFLLNGYTGGTTLNQREYVRFAWYRLYHYFWLTSLLLKRKRKWKRHYEKTMELYELFQEEEWEDML